MLVKKNVCNYFCSRKRIRDFILVFLRTGRFRYIENKSTTVDNTRKIGVSWVKDVSNRTSSTFAMAAKLADSGKGKEKRSKVKYSSMVLFSCSLFHLRREIEGQKKKKEKCFTYLNIYIDVSLVKKHRGNTSRCKCKVRHILITLFSFERK